MGLHGVVVKQCYSCSLTSSSIQLKTSCLAFKGLPGAPAKCFIFCYQQLPPALAAPRFHHRCSDLFVASDTCMAYLQSLQQQACQAAPSLSESVSEVCMQSCIESSNIQWITFSLVIHIPSALLCVCLSLPSLVLLGIGSAKHPDQRAGGIRS